MLALVPSVATLVNVLTVAVGLGFVIFFHELGHFAVAKWCDVLVERFSIGFGPVLLRKKWGETEYALSAIPFGGYVKMLGQDDIDPSQLTSEEIAEDPRSYTAKGVLQRMAIISAGVIMNVVTGLLFFMTAFRMGIEVTPAVVGDVQVGMPAWNAGMRMGDRITEINGRDIEDFNDLMQATALSSGTLKIQAVRPEGEVYTVTLTPDISGTRRRIGVTPSRGLKLLKSPKEGEIPAVVPESAAARAQPPLEPGDVIAAFNDEPVETYAQLSELFSDHRSETVSLTVTRKSDPDGPNSGQPVTVSVPAAPFVSPGLRMDIGKIVALQKGSPADRAGIRIGDKLASVDDRDIGKEIDPFHLPDYFAERHGQSVVVGIVREAPGGQAEIEQVTLTPDDLGGWSVPPILEDTPLAIPSIGLAYHVQSTVLAVDEAGPADRAGIRPLDAITKLELILPEDAVPDGIGESDISIDIGDTNLAFAFWQMQQFPNRQVRLTVQSAGSDKTRTIDIIPAEADDWFLPTARGIRFFAQSQPRKAETAAQAFSMGWDHTRSSIVNIYLTLRNLVTGHLSVKELHGPLGILSVASDVAEVGIAPFLLFLGFLSINLAVLNFLPIPVLDGGHMVFLIWEAVSRKRPNEQVVVAATVAGMVFVVALMALVLYLDISRWYQGSM